MFRCEHFEHFLVCAGRQLDAFGSPVQYLEAAFHNVYSGGVVVVTATDVASLYGKCARTLLRNYGARLVAGVDYRKELAVRILLAAVAQSVLC